MELSLIVRYLVPKGVWLKRTILLFAFIFLDYLVTIIFCKTPYAEGNLLARSFMQTYGIVMGLTIFDLLLGIPIYGILCIDSYLIKYTEQHSTKAELAVDLALGWLIAGGHFNGAASWLWNAPHLMRQTLGFMIYLAIAFPSLYSPPRLSFLKSVLAPFRQKNMEA
ncbi:hypothetical protein CW712_04130 [Candidatus Bathyarchaeota archaeon]|nr:MAG: hypothetical protein CW712_04130 [Candidatus Bathyarchaeota archaeon]